MSLIQVKLKHGRTFDDAKAQLGRAVAEIQGRFAGLIRGVEWSPSRDSVVLTGPGVRLDLKVDAEEVHASGDIPFLGGLFGGSANLRKIVESAFLKRLG